MLVVLSVIPHPDVIHDSIVIGAGQAGLSASYHLKRLGVDHVVLDSGSRPGGAWQHRWDSLTMADVHGVSDLPGTPRLPASPELRANLAVPTYFAQYEETHQLPVIRAITVVRVEPHPEGFAIHGDTDRGRRTWLSRTVVNATGTWTRPFVPHLPGQGTFEGRQLHTVDFPGPAWFAGRRTVVVGGGASAVQFLGDLARVVGAEGLVWVTRQSPVWRTTEFTPEVGAEVVARVADRVRAGLPPRSVVSVTGLQLREQERVAAELGVYAARRPLFSRIEADGVRWDRPEPGSKPYEPVDVILWATGFRPAIDHLAPLHLRSRHGGVQLADDETTAVLDPRVQFVGYGPSASTIGANRAGRRAAMGVRRALQVEAATSLAG